MQLIFYSFQIYLQTQNEAADNNHMYTLKEIQTYEDSGVRDETYLEYLLTRHDICKKHQDGCQRLFSTSGDKQAEPMTFKKVEVTLNQQESHIPMYFRKGGRLGNKMYQYAGMYQLAKFYNRELIIDSMMARYLNNSFVMNSTWFTVQKFFRMSDHIPEQVNLGLPHHVVKPEMYELAFNETPVSCFNTHLYFFHDSQEIRSLFTFKKWIIEKARASLSLVFGDSNVVKIGIHVRRGDRARRHKLAPQQYFINAMDYFKRKYRSVRFVVTTEPEEKKWVKENLCQFPNVTLLDESVDRDSWTSKFTDMAALTMCDHLIISIGSYGFWSGFLNKGEVIYYNGDNKEPHDVYVPQAWIPMTEKKIPTANG